MSSVDEVLRRARSRLTRVSPAALGALPDDHLLVDIRPLHNRAADGEIPGARDLQDVGLPHATDLEGGFRAYRTAGLPVQEGGTPAIT